jgi:hypothetical protein
MPELGGEPQDGDLREFGLPFSRGVHQSDADDVVEETEEAAPAVEEEEQVSTTPAEPTAAEEAAPEEEEEYEDEYAAMLARVRKASVEEEEQPKPQASPEAAVLQARLDAMEERLRNYEPPAKQVEQPKPEPKDEGIDYNDPAVQKALAQALADPRTAGPTIRALVELESRGLVESTVGELKEQVQTLTSTKEQEKESSERLAKLQRGLQASYQLGGLEAAIVMEAEERGEGSLLYQYLELNPHLLEDPKGIVTATLAVARAVEKADASLDQPTDTKKGPAPLSGKRQTRASKRGRNLTTPTEEADPAETMKNEIVGAGRPSDALEFMR